MSILRNWSIEGLNIQIIKDMKVGDTVVIEDGSVVTMSGRIYDHPSYGEGMLLVTSPIVEFVRETEKNFLAKTKKREYTFELELSAPITLRSWHPAYQQDEERISSILPSGAILEEGIVLMGNPDGITSAPTSTIFTDPIRVFERTADGDLLATASSDVQYRLSPHEKMGFWDNCKELTKWHWDFDPYAYSSAELRKIFGDIVKTYNPKLESGKILAGLHADVPENLKLCFVGKINGSLRRYTTSFVKKVFSIRMPKRTEVYLMMANNHDDLIKLDPNSIDKIQKQLLISAHLEL